MIITGIRHKVGAESDARRTASFTKYLIHYLRMFAIMGIIIPVLIGVDYVLEPQTNYEIVNNKFYEILSNNNIEYLVFTDFRRLNTSSTFYDHVNEGDQLTLYHTPIFHTTTLVTFQSNSNEYKCKLFSIYGWPLLAVVSTFVCSIILMMMTGQKRKKNNDYVKYDSVINLGVINAFLCIFTLIAILFHIP